MTKAKHLSENAALEDRSPVDEFVILSWTKMAAHGSGNQDQNKQFHPHKLFFFTNVRENNKNKTPFRTRSSGGRPP